MQHNNSDMIFLARQVIHYLQLFHSCHHYCFEFIHCIDFAA
jgi:hypothetical protein